MEGGLRRAFAAVVDAAASSTTTSTATRPSQGSCDRPFGCKRLQAGASSSSASGATAAPCHSHAASGGGHAVQGQRHGC